MVRNSEALIALGFRLSFSKCLERESAFFGTPTMPQTHEVKHINPTKPRADPCVSTRCATFDIDIYRWGAKRELVWSARALVGVVQPTPDDADANGCGWLPTVDVPVDSSWRSGMYLIELTTSAEDPTRRVGYACFVLRGSSQKNRALLVLATNTWNAYNNWGGRSLYTGGNLVSFRRPFGRGMLMRQDTERDDRKSWPRRFGEQPDINGDHYQDVRLESGYPGYMSSAGWFTYERRFVEWAENAGYEFDYAVSSDLEQFDKLNDNYDLVVGVGHDEYWSADQRTAIESFVKNGGNYASFSGNTMFWQVRLEDNGANMRCYKYGAHTTDPILVSDPTKMSGMWADPIVGKPESMFLGAGSMYGLYARFGLATPRGVGGFVIYRNDHWMLAGTDLRYGDVLGADDAIVGYETVGTRITFDQINLPIIVDDDARLPDDVEIVGFTPASNLAMGEYPNSIAALDDQGDLEFIAERVYGGGPTALALVRHGNAVMLCCWPFGRAVGQVVTIGSTDWVYGLGDSQVATVTSNILNHLLSVGS